MLLIDYLAKEEAINGECYANKIHEIRDAVAKKRPIKLKLGVIMGQGNSIPLTS